MKKKISKHMKRDMLLMFVFLFLAVPLGFGEVVYLKAGKVMTGRIVEKNDKYIVIKSSEDAAAVKTTIYFEDINRIENDEQYAQETSLIPTQLAPQNTSQPLGVPPTKVPLPDQGTDESYVKGLAEENRQWVPPSAVASIPQKGSSSRGTGTVSGAVRLPDDFMKYKGDLYVFLMRPTDNGSFFMPFSLLYQKIDKDSINAAVILYKIKNVPPGIYKVFAQWDIASPFFIKKKLQGIETLLGFGMKGDYAGSQDSTVVVKKNETKGSVNLDCVQLLTRDQADSYSEVASGFEVTDLYYQKLYPEGAALYLRIKNTGTAPIESLNLSVLIEDEKGVFSPLSLGPIAPAEEKDFDISASFDAYKKQKLAQKEEATGKMLKFKIVSEDTGEVVIEKAIFIL